MFFFFNKNWITFKICWENYSSSGVVSFRTLPIMLPTVCMNKSLQNKHSTRRRTWTIYEHFFNFQFSVFIGFVYLLPLPLRSQNPLKCLCFVLIKFCAFWRLCGYFNKQPKKLPNTHLPMEVVLGRQVELTEVKTSEMFVNVYFFLSETTDALIVFNV